MSSPGVMIKDGQYSWKRVGIHRNHTKFQERIIVYLCIMMLNNYVFGLSIKVFLLNFYLKQHKIIIPSGYVLLYISYYVPSCIGMDGSHSKYLI